MNFFVFFFCLFPPSIILMLTTKMLSFADKSFSTSGLLLLGSCVRRSGSVQNLKQTVHSRSHAGVQMRLRAFDVIVEVVSEGLDVVDGSFAVLEVGLEKNKHNKALGFFGSHSRNTLQLIWRFSGSKCHSGSAVEVSSSIRELLQEDTGKDLIVGIFKVDGEDDGDGVGTTFDVDGFIVTIIDGDDTGGWRSSQSGLECLLEGSSQ